MWKQAKDDYLQTVSTGGNTREIDMPNVRSLDDLVSELNKQKLKFTTFRSKGQSGLDLLRKFLQPVQVAGEILAGPASGIFPPSTQILGAITFLIKVSSFDTKGRTRHF